MVRESLDVALVISDRPCRGLDVAREHGVEAVLVDRQVYGGFTTNFDRDGYTQRLTETLLEHRIDLVAMAGFGTILTSRFHLAYPGRVLNTHPSLLPDFKGWHAVAQALDAGVTETGCTVHIATEALDDGPILAQRRVPVLAGDDEATLHERIKDVERELYPAVVGRVMASLTQGLEPVSVAESKES